MSVLTHVPVATLPPQRFQSVLADDRYEAFASLVEQAERFFQGRVVWNINSTAKGGGVAEMLQSLLAYARGAGIDARWVVIAGNDDFFRVTKRIHNHLHGAPGDGGELGPQEREIYEAANAVNADELTERIEPDDIVIVHDPQPAALVPVIKKAGAAVIWRCHVGLDWPNELSRRAWNFLIPYVSEADAYVFSRRAFAWEGLDEKKIRIIPPSIDAFSPKNQHLDPEVVEGILAKTGLVQGDVDGNRTFTREDGSPGRVEREAEKLPGAPPPPPVSAKIVTQVSRWDRLKDPVGVIDGFADHVAPRTDAHLIVAGPAVQAVADDPEGLEVLRESHEAWQRLPDPVKERVHLVCLPMYDSEENAAIVNALQRRADVVVQKSLAEGFGLTVAEAMWKARPMVASRIGGIQDQIIHGRCGLLVDNPSDLAAFGDAVTRLLQDTEEAARMGKEAQARVRSDFLGPRHLMQYFELIAMLVQQTAGV